MIQGSVSVDNFGGVEILESSPWHMELEHVCGISKCPDHFFTFSYFSQAYFSSAAFSHLFVLSTFFVD